MVDFQDPAARCLQYTPLWRLGAQRSKNGVRCTFLEVSPKVKLLLHAESEACSCADFLHADFFEPEALKLGACERPKAGA